jgi:hypothetical protein
MAILIAAFLTLVGVGVDLPRPPTFQFVDAVGCGLVVLMAWNQDSSEVLTIRFDPAMPGDREMSFDLGKSTKGIEVRVDAFHDPQSFLRCGDVGTPLHVIQDSRSGWLPVAGKLRVRVDRVRKIAAVEVRDLVVQSSKGDRVGAKRVLRFVAQLHALY